jgi:hypothetical protein
MIFTILALAVQSAFTVSNAVYSGPIVRSANARLIWRDEFSGTALNPARWSYDTAWNKRGWFNRELQYYSAAREKNLRLRDGHLIIEAHPGVVLRLGRTALHVGEGRSPKGADGPTVSAKRGELPAGVARGKPSGCSPSR